ncbi:PlsC domain-containing protein [Durusdinium trenchii]|uniref:PlsC domain-containing protein n=1 Tax=Durusdinium trenchii TaxID=1381693 RepID=A0ABP0ND98_9DINO
MSADKTSESQCLHPEQEAAAAEQLFSGFGPMKLARPSEPKKPEQTKEVDEEVGDVADVKAKGVKADGAGTVGPVDGSTSAGSGAESLEDTFGSSASKEYTFGSSHSQQLGPSKPKLPPLGPSGSSVKKMPLAERRGDRSPKGGSCPSPKLSARRNKGEEDDDDGCEFTFGTSAPIQLPDFSQQKPASATEASSLRQIGSAGDEKPAQTLAPVQEAPEKPANDRPLPPRSPPPSFHRPSPPKNASQIQPPWVKSPRTASPRLPGNWHPHMPQAPGVYGQMPQQQLQQQMYVQRIPNGEEDFSTLAIHDGAVGHFPVYFTSSKNGVFAVDKERNEQVDKQVDQFLKEGGWLCFYPEGQRNKSPDELLPFRYGGMKKVIEFDGRLMSLMCYNVQTVWPLKAQMGGYPGRVRMSCKALAPDGVKALLKQLRESDLPPEEKEAEDHVLLAKHLQRTMQQQYDELKAAAMESAKPKKA